ncbi:MAG: hypothetical protein E6Q78_12120 [Rhodoferax sp.]|nr:MAG: hypothetical protein E6Q78_12120 [Rhodoferax sp.]
MNFHVAAPIHNKEGNQRMQFSPSCQTDSAEQSETARLKIGGAARALAVVACVACLVACSSQPETADIQKDLAEAYACPVIELSDVKKADGAKADGKLYDVSFTHTVSVKGGAEAAAKLFSEWAYLEALVQPTQIALDKALFEADSRAAQGQLPGGRNADPEVRRLTQAKEQLASRLASLMPCETIEAVTRLQVMRSAAEEAAKSGQSQVAVPVAIKVRGTGRMGKAESGWHFADMPAFSTVEIVTASATYPRFKAEATASTSASSEARRLVGKVRAGNTDSCLEVPVSGDTKCYTLPSEPELATRIFGTCKDGDTCAITGQFDDKNEKLIQFSKAEKVAP